MHRAAGRAWFDGGRAVAGIAIVLCLAHAAGAQSADTALRVSPESAVELALANNLFLESARRTPEMAGFDILAAHGAWAPSVLATVGHDRSDSPATTSFDRTLGVLTDRQVASGISVSQLLPWGASYEAGWSSLRRSSNSLLNRFQPELTAAATARVTQPLLRGLAIDAARANHARSLQAGDRSAFELNGTIAALRREVLYAYWQWIYAREFRVVAREALALAQALLAGNRERVAAKAMAATDLIEAEAEVARREEAVIVAEKNVANTEERLRLLILNPQSPQYQTPLEPGDLDGPGAIAGGTDPLPRTLAERSDLRVLRSTVATNDVNLRQLKNEALPDLDLSAAFSTRAVGGTELVREGGLGTPVTGALEHGFGAVLGDLGQFRYPGWSVQVSVGYPAGAVVAKAAAARARVEKRQSELALAALEQRVATEVRTAQREVETNQKRLQSTETAGALAERRLAAEEEKFLVGLSTSFFVFQAQRDLASARVARLGAVLDRRLSVADLEAIQRTPLAPIR
jgi:outer membrane protein TolC